MRLGLIASVVWALASVACNKGDDSKKSAPPAAPQPPATSQPAPDQARGMPMPRLEDMPVDDSGVDNLAEMLERLNLAAYHKRGFRGQGVKIAVLDNGFTGLSRSAGKRLPPGLVVEPAPRPEMQDTTHGTKLAEIAYALATGSATYSAALSGPELLLFNANGFSNLKAAIDEIVRRQVDIVLYAQVWEYGGNGDGGGFINREVSRATAAGVLWVNAAGNFGRATYGSGIKILADQATVQLPSQSRYLRFTVPQDGTPVKIVLSWNDFDESKDYRTPQDLDLVVVDEEGNEVGSSRLVQAGNAPVAPREGQASAHAREMVSTQLDVGTYRVRVEAKSRNFDAQSRLRITIDGADVRIVDGTANDSVLIPADNRSVLAIGATDVGYSSRAVLPDGRRKPEISLVSEVRFDDGMTVRGTSAATAIAVGALSVLRSAEGKLLYEDVMAMIQKGRLVTPLSLPEP